MKRIKLTVTAIVAVVGVTAAFATKNALLPNVQIIFGDGSSSIRDLASKGQTWDCQNMMPNTCYFLEFLPGSGDFTMPSVTLGYAIPLP